MSQEARFTLALRTRPVTLHYPGAEGIVFHDAVFALRNDSEGAADRPRLFVKISQGDRVLAETAVDLAAFGVAPILAPGEETVFSLFRMMQKHVEGFGSRVNLFGYKAALDWTYRVSAAPFSHGEEGSSLPLRTWEVRWQPSEADDQLVEVEIR